MKVINFFKKLFGIKDNDVKIDLTIVSPSLDLRLEEEVKPELDLTVFKSPFAWEQDTTSPTPKVEKIDKKIKKAPVKKAPVKKAPVKKTPVKKVAAKKVAIKKTIIKKKK